MTKEPSKYIILGLHLVVWLFLFVVSVSIQLRDYGFENSFLRAIVNLSTIAGLFYIHFYLIDYLFEKKRYVLYAITVILIIGITTIGRVYFNEEMMRLPVDQIIIDRTLSVWLFGVVTCFAALVVSFLYQMIKNRYAKERLHLEIINQQNEAKIQYLKAQINPHFLFNSLNNIYSLSVIKSDQTPDMVLKLSSLLRYAIYEGEKKKVPLIREVEQIKEFIALFEMKSEEKLNVDFLVEGSMADVEIEPMLLIPLVENCFKHGNFEQNPAAFAEIKLELNQGKLSFSTKNIMDTNQQKDEVGGVGLSNIRKRLDLNYPDRHTFATKSDDGLFMVHLSLNLN